MNAAELQTRILAYGADGEGIRDRFGDNAELYKMCFEEFLEEPNFAVLAEAMDAKAYARAFDAAHALKGLSGNLGVTPFYDAVCVLVESLRANRYDNVAAEYAKVCHERERLVHLVSAQPREPAEPSAERQTAETIADNGAEKREKPGDRGWQRDKFAPRAIVLILIALVAIGYMFFRISINYRENVVQESGKHLIEMSNQIRLYVEEQIDNDWKVAYSVGDNMTDVGYTVDDRAMLHMLQKKRLVWGVSDLMLYTEDGYCVYADGRTEVNDVASELIVQARNGGKYLSVIDSRLIYTVPVESEQTYNNSKVVAVSVVQDMETFLDDMHFSSFDERAWMYLTEDNGIVISRLTNPAAVSAFNFKSVVKDMRIAPLDETHSTDDLFSAAGTVAFLVSDAATKNYVVSVPVATGAAPLRLFYLAPEAVVNSTTNGFSRQLTGFSMLMVALFAILAFLTFLFMYLGRKKLFDRAILARERMFDLLIKNTRTAFALFDINEAEPVYISSNAIDVIGDRYWALDRTDAGYRMRNSEDTETETIRHSNERLADWDGKHVFKSGYIQNDLAVPPYWFEYQLYPIDDAGTDFVGIAQDVTQAYEREEATKSAMEMATRANEAKSRFLSNMSHDIRTPMNAIMNMTNFALENIDQPKKLGPYLHTIRESSEHLLHLINEVLDMNRIESGRTVVSSEPFDLRAEMERQVDMARSLAEARQQTLITDFDGLGTTVVCGDALKLSQIVMNLLSNAIKFTPEKGAVRFIATQIPSLSDDIVDVRFSIEDNGIGVSKADLQRIFEPFCRADDKRVGKIEGTGLGLSICKSYVDAMGGTIRCESEEGEGSTFTVELFFEKTGADAVESANADARGGDTPFLGMHCLVVEDNETNQLIAKALLERTGFIVDMADDGSDGVQKFFSAKPGTYDVIYMDIRMPVMDGYEATTRIRGSSHPQAKTVPIVAMTANVYAEDIEKARIAGMDAYLGKPLVSFDLVEQTNKAIRRNRRVEG